MARKRKDLTLEQKKQLIADKDAGKSVDDLKKKFGIGKSTVYDIINDWKSIFAKIDDGADPKKKRMKLEETQLNDAALSLQSFIEQNAGYKAVKLIDKLKTILIPSA